MKGLSDIRVYSNQSSGVSFSSSSSFRKFLDNSMELFSSIPMMQLAKIIEARSAFDVQIMNDTGNVCFPRRLFMVRSFLGIKADDTIAIKEEMSKQNRRDADDECATQRNATIENK